MRRSQFLGIHSLIDTDQRSYYDQIPALENSVKNVDFKDGDKCTAGRVLDYLSNTYKLALLYRQVEAKVGNTSKSKIEELIALVNSYQLSLPEYAKEFEVTLNLLQEMLAVKQGRLKYRRRYLQGVIDYAIAADNAHLLAIALNKLGFYYNNLYQNDIACVYYLLSIYVCYTHQADYSQKEYNALILHPVMNLITTMGEKNKNIAIKAQLFNSSVLDNQSRLLLGGILQNYIEDERNKDKEAVLFNPGSFADLRERLYEDADWQTVHGRIEKLYEQSRHNPAKIVELEHFYKENSETWDDNEKLGALFRLRHKEEQSDFVIGHLTPDLYFRHSVWIHKHWDDFLIDAQDHILERMITDVRILKAQLSYEPAKPLFDAIQRGRALYTPERLGHIMLKHSGTNLVYKRVYDDAVSPIASYCGLPEGKGWIRHAIGIMGFERADISEGLISAILASLEKHCTFYPHYLALVENMFLLRNMISGREQYNLYQTLIRRTGNASRRELLFNEFRYLNPAQKDNGEEKGIDYEALCRDYDTGGESQNDGYAIKIFKLLDYSSQNHQSTKAVLSVEQKASLEAAGRRLSIDYSGIRNSEEYQSCIKVLQDASWEVNDMDINRSFLLLEKNGVSAVIFFMFEPEKDWLADESPFNEGVPQWFSMTSNIESPVYRVKQYSASYNSGNNRLFVLIAPPAYVINADNMRDAWDGVTVVKLSGFNAFVKSHGMLPDVSDFEDLSKVESPGAQLSDLPPDDELARQDIISQILDKRESVKRQYKEAEGGPWNFSRIYLDYRYNPYLGYGDSSVDEMQYDLSNSAFMHVLNKLGLSHLAQLEIKDAHFILYLRRTSVKFSMWVKAVDDGLTVESFKVENYRSDELKYIDRKNSDPRIGFADRGGIFLLGNIVEDECAIIYRFLPGKGSRYERLDARRQNELRQSIRQKFCDALVAVGKEELWRSSLAALTNLILHDEVKQLAEKTAQTAIMARNMSHNLGSHVMAYVKRDLSSAKEIFDRGLLRDFYPFCDIDQYGVNGSEQFLRYAERRSKTVDLPFLLGLGKFISYLQERQDFIATVATDYIPYFSEINFCDDVFDTINLDYRFLRNGESAGGRQENILLKYIALSEGLSRGGNEQSDNGNIVIRFRKYDGVNDYRDQPNRGIKKPKGPGWRDLESMRTYSFHMPGGIVGRQALFSIMENLIRNSAKHGNWRSGQKNLEFTFDVFNGRALKTDASCEGLYRFLAEQPEWKGVILDPSRPLDKYYLLTITDNLPIRDADLLSISKAISEEYVDDNSVFIDNHKGIKEIRISAAWLRGIANDLHRPAGEPPVVTVRKVNDNLQYIFCIFAPRKAVVIADNPSEFDALKAAMGTWEGWDVISSKDYVQSNYKTATAIAVRDRATYQGMLPFSPDRLVLLDDKQYQSILSGQSDESTVFKELVFRIYKIDKNDGPILISDGKARESESPYIHVVRSDSEAEGVYHYAYRTHHSNPEEFNDYMHGSLRQNMLAVEGVSGNNSTDRLIRSERLDDIWYCKHLNALRTKVAIFDERLFSKLCGLSDEQLLALPDNGVIEASLDALVSEQKRLWLFNIIARSDGDNLRFDVFGLVGSEDPYKCAVGRIASIKPTTFDCKYGSIPHIAVRFVSSEYQHFFDYISIHQGILDKIYDGLNINNITAQGNLRQDVIAVAKCGITTAICNAFQAGGSPVGTVEDIKRFQSGFFIHSGRSKPSDYDMPQSVPFIQFSAIENAAFDCKYSLVELMKSAYYE